MARIRTICAGGDVGATRALVKLAELEERAQRYVIKSKSANTWRAYKSDLKHFGAWCDASGSVSLPAEPDAVKPYPVDHAGVVAMSTLRRRLAAISEVHNAREFDNPTTSPEEQFVWKGTLTTHPSAPHSKEAAVTEVVATLVKPLGSSLTDVRDRAVVLIGFAGAMRRSEIAALDADDITETGEGLRVRIMRSKTDQQGAGDTIGITYGSNPPTCPVRAWSAWVEASEVDAGGAFRRVRNGRVTSERLQGRGIARMVQRRAQAAGLAAKLYVERWPCPLGEQAAVADPPKLVRR